MSNARNTIRFSTHDSAGFARRGGLTVFVVLRFLILKVQLDEPGSMRLREAFMSEARDTATTVKPNIETLEERRLLSSAVMPAAACADGPSMDARTGTANTLTIVQ